MVKLLLGKVSVGAESATVLSTIIRVEPPSINYTSESPCLPEQRQTSFTQELINSLGFHILISVAHQTRIN